MEVIQIVNTLYSSNSYILSNKDDYWALLIDVGESERIFESLPLGISVKGAFITHAHIDHIYGINKLIELFPECILYASCEAKKGLFSDKLNLSFYHETPIIYRGSNVHILNDSNKIELFDNCFLEAIETPGHNWGCLSYKVNDFLFTGDSYIPNIDVVTKLKGGDKVANEKSLEKIFNLISNKTIICPGHGAIVQIHNPH